MSSFSTMRLHGFLLGAGAACLLAANIPATAKSPPTPGLHAYAQGHAARDNPPDRLGGPMTVKVHQKSGSTRWVLPGARFLDPSTFGTPAQPVGMDPAPFPLLGVPLKLRKSANGHYTFADHATPFSDWREVGVGDLDMTAVDATALDGARTKDKVHFDATFKSPDGKFNYRVTAAKPIPHGMAYPFFGGVVTNHLMHGATGIGTRLMPTEFSYVAFWAIGNVYRDGKLVNEKQLVHVMVTEVVRKEGYKLGFDGDVGDPPSGITLHLMVPPFKVTPKGLAPAPLRTGFIPFPFVKKHMMATMKAVKQMPGGPQKKAKMAALQQVKTMMGRTKEHVMAAMKAGKMDGQPFFHVMFGNIEMTANR